MPLHPTLARHVTAAAIGDDLVFLDLAGDRYLGVPGALPHAHSGPPDLSDLPPELLEELTRAGLVAWSNAPRRAGSVPRPMRDLPAGPAPGLGLRDLAGVARNLLDYLFRYRGASLARLLARAAAERPAAPRPVETALWTRVRVHRRRLTLSPLPRKCLLQSFLLLRALRRDGYDARWVLGVRVWPFLAHCWLQVGDVVLDDFVDRLDAFEPILAV